MTDPGPQNTYRPDIDGLRAVSILAVVLHHFDVPFFEGGFVGVDVFFVISGYLITGIVAADMRAGGFSFARFYERRARRLLPTLTVMLVTVFLVSVAVMTPMDLQELSKSMAYALVFAANLFFAEQGGYFDPALDTAPLLHTWSLAVEEQFYIVWPLLLLLVMRFAPKRALWAAALLLLASLAVSVAVVAQKPIAAFFYPHTRFWELLAGSMLALGLPAMRRNLAPLAGGIGLALILAAILTYGDRTPFPGVAAIVPVLGAALIIAAGQSAPNAPVSRALSWRPMVFVGLVSYAWYLWHWPMIVLFRYQMERAPSLAETIALIAASFILAAASWRYLEQPIRHGAWWKPRAFAFKSAAGATLALLGLAGAGYATDGFIARHPEAMRDLSPSRLTVRAKDSACPRQAAAMIAAGKVCDVWNAGPDRPSVLLWGDSHAGVIRPAFRDLGEATKTSVALVSAPACPPLIGIGRHRRRSGPDSCEQLNVAVADLLKTRAFRDVVLVARWDYYAIGLSPKGVPAPEQHYLRDARSAATSLEENRLTMERNFGATVDAIAASGARVWLMMEAPYVGFNVPNRMARRLMRGEKQGSTVWGADSAEQRERAAFVRRLAQKYRVGVIDPSGPLCKSERCLAALDGKPLYFDDNHLSIYGASLLEPLLAPVFAPAEGRIGAAPAPAP